MLSNARKFICSLLALAVLLAPLEFAVAHDMSNSVQEQMMAHHHADAGMDHHSMDMDATESNCDGQELCNDCVYCSPALNISSHFQLDRPHGAQPVAVALPHYSIDLPVDIRPPRPL